jgi:Piwi domain
MLAVHVQELLGVFSKKNKRLPEVLVMYRDGVSEGQFDEVGACQAVELPGEQVHV